ncbi:MAG: hypothetical protein CL572_03935 [Alphaproteobacteria bacterium]|nr:hypothetical protein [Alphaproteobacteria bacterium]|tara:strand:+ start:148 stop:675 length:528 start_codon:yes stop_codon:yes gene_type:complete
MSEQVINIKDRIEKMRTQMTGPNEAVARDKVNLEKTANSNLHNKKSKFNENQMSSIKNIENSKVEDLPLAREKVEKIEKKRNEQEFGKKANESKNFEYSSFESKPKPASANKTYKDYHNDNIFDENKKSVRLEDNQAFPQFNLNVSNPISWKLMLLIMLMQLLTNIMLVVVLYLK